jgi:hypothetical protein
VFCALIEVKIKTGRVDAGNRAYELLDRLERFADGMAESPDSKVYTKIMTAYWKLGGEDAVASCKLFFNEQKRRMKEGTLLVPSQITTRLSL